MTRQTWTATVSAVLFVVLAAVIALVPVPYVTWSPGGTYDLLGEAGGKPVISVSGAETFPTRGRLLMTTVALTAADSTLSLPEVFFSYWLPSREVLPRSSVYGVGDDVGDITEEETRQMTDSQSEAVVAALRQSGVEVIPWPMVQSVSSSGPASGRLQPGDLIQAVGGSTTTSTQAVLDKVADVHVGESVRFTVLRDGQQVEVDVTTRSTTAEPEKPIVGITVTTGYTYKPTIEFAVDPAVGGSSAGLMFGLALVDRLTASNLVGDRVVAGTGTLGADGVVGRIGGVQEKIAAASRDGASVFLLPRDNCADVGPVPAGLRIVPVDTLGEGVDALKALLDPEAARAVAGCP